MRQHDDYCALDVFVVVARYVSKTSNDTTDWKTRFVEPSSTVISVLVLLVRPAEYLWSATAFYSCTRMALPSTRARSLTTLAVRPVRHHARLAGWIAPTAIARAENGRKQQCRRGENIRRSVPAGRTTPLATRDRGVGVFQANANWCREHRSSLEVSCLVVPCPNVRLLTNPDATPFVGRSTPTSGLGRNDGRSRYRGRVVGCAVAPLRA